MNLCVIGVLDHRDPAAKDRNAVALHKGSVPLASVVILRAFPDEVVQSRRVEARAPPAEGNLPPAANEDVNVIRGEGPQAGLHFLCVGRNRVGLQDEALGVCELGAPTSFVLHDCAPQVDLAADAAPLVA